MSKIWPEIDDDNHLKSIVMSKLPKACLKRNSDDGVQTLGSLYYRDKEVAKTLELAWKDNKPRISCIPKGVYICEARKSNKYSDHWWVKDVEGRDMILIHHGNFYKDIMGCILVGNTYSDINKDGHVDVLSSKATMVNLKKLLPKKFVLEIL